MIRSPSQVEIRTGELVVQLHVIVTGPAREAGNYLPRAEAGGMQGRTRGGVLARQHSPPHSNDKSDRPIPWNCHISAAPSSVQGYIGELRKTVCNIKIYVTRYMQQIVFTCGLAVAKPQSLAVTRFWKRFCLFHCCVRPNRNIGPVSVVMTTLGLCLISLRQWSFINGSHATASSSHLILPV